METIAYFEGLIQAMRSELGEQTIVIQELAVVITESERLIVQRDQVTWLRILKPRVMSEVKDVERTESTAQYRDDKIALFGGAPAAFTFGILFADAIGIKNAPQVGVSLMLSTLANKNPFGTVVIAIGKRGLPEGLKIIPLSLWARESNRKELEVENSLKHEGYLLMTPEQFAELLGKVECGILDGSYSLPLTVDALRSLVM